MSKHYHTNRGLTKRCACKRGAWETCPHTWVFAFMWKGTPYRGSLGVSDRDEAIAKFASVKAQIMNGTYARATKSEPATAPQADRPTFAMVAKHYTDDPEGLEKLSSSQKRQLRYDVVFLSTVTVPPGLPFTEKPFADIIRADIKLAVSAKAISTTKTYEHPKSGRTWTKTVGGKPPRTGCTIICGRSGTGRSKSSTRQSHRSSVHEKARTG